MRRISYIITSLIMVFSMATTTAFVRPDWPIDTGIRSEADIVMDMDPGAVLFAQNIYEQKIPANITKLLTALAVIEDTNDLDAPVTFSHDVIYSVKSGADNKFNLEERDVLSVRQYLYAMLPQLFNQSANALAEYMTGSRQAFVDMINQRIAELGCNENHFTNPSGSNGNTQRTTACDMAIIARVCLRNPTALGIASARTSAIPVTTNNSDGRTFPIEHKMLLSDDSNCCLGAIAGKTDWTSQVGQTLVTYIRRGGRGQIAVTLRSTQRIHYSDTETILDFYLAKFKNADTTDNEVEYVTGDVPVTIAGETYDPSELSTKSKAVTTIPSDTRFTDVDKAPEMDLPENHPQETVARLVYTYNERRVGGAWTYSSRVRVVNATPSEPGGDMPQGSQPGKDGQDRKTGLKLPGAVLIGGGTVLVLVPIVGGGVFWFKRQWAVERERQRILREKRKQRLADISYTEEDFERLLDERRKQHDTR